MTTSIEQLGSDRHMMITDEALSANVVCAILSEISEQRLKANASMSSYKVSAHANGSGYAVHVIGSDWARQTMLGFETEADAQSWIESDKARDGLSLTSNKTGRTHP
jgi:hypothetical protein